MIVGSLTIDKVNTKAEIVNPQIVVLLMFMMYIFVLLFGQDNKRI